MYFQSEIASERPGVFDSLREGVARMVGWTTPHATRLLPIYKLVLPTLLHGMCHYAISSLAMYTVSVSIKAEIMEVKVSTVTVSTHQGRGQGKHNYIVNTSKQRSWRSM